MKYFLHDTSAFEDEKVTLLYMRYGYEAVGLFYAILERIAGQEKPIAEKVIKTQLHIKKKLQKQLNFMYEIDILSIRNGDVFNENLMSFSQKYKIKKEKTRKRVEEWRAKQQPSENVTRYKIVRNDGKDNISKEKKYNTLFESLWNIYPKKENRKEAERHFNASVKTEDDCHHIEKALENYKSYVSQNDTEYKYIKMGSTWFNNWRDWIEMEGEFSGEAEALARNRKRLVDMGKSEAEIKEIMG